MSHYHTLSKGPYFLVRPNGSLPASIADEYRAGATVKQLAAEHRTYIGRVAAELMAMGVELRRKGPAVEEEIVRLHSIVALRQAGMTLRAIGERFGITRERVRQILLPNYAKSRKAQRRAA